MAKGSLLNAIKRGVAGMRKGYSEAHVERVREEQSKKKPSGKSEILGVLVRLIILIGVVVIVVAVVAPQVFRVRGVQTPVNVTLREGILTANVLRIQNLSRDHLPNVNVTALRPSTGEREAKWIESLAPGQIIELGGLQWNWVVRNGDTVTVDADGFLPMVFTSDQMIGR